MCMIFKAAFSAMTTFFFCALKFKNQPGSLMVHMLEKRKKSFMSGAVHVQWLTTFLEIARVSLKFISSNRRTILGIMSYFQK